MHKMYFEHSPPLPSSSYPGPLHMAPSNLRASPVFFNNPLSPINAAYGCEASPCGMCNLWVAKAPN